MSAGDGTPRDTEVTVEWNGSWYTFTPESGESWTFEPEDVEDLSYIKDSLVIWRALLQYHLEGNWAHKEGN